MSDLATTLDAPEPEPQAPSDPFAEARAAGYGWGDIFDHVAKATDTALQQGYTQDEVDRHLGYRDPADFKDRARAGWASAIANEPQILDNLGGSQPQLDLTRSPTLASDYAQALLNREVKGPQDFAEHYAAAALDAAHDSLDDSDLNSVRARQAAGAQAADALSASLPSNSDLTDAALSLSMGTMADYDQVRGNLLDHWQQTGQQPVDAAAKASTNSDLADKLTGQVWQPPTLAELSQPQRDAIQKFYAVPGEELVDAKSMHEALVDAGIDVATVAGLNLAGKYVVGPLMRMAMQKLGAIPEWLTSLAERAPTSVVSTVKPPGQAVIEKPWAEALEAPKPAAREPAPIEGEGVPAPSARPFTFAKDGGGTGSGIYDITSPEGEKVAFANASFLEGGKKLYLSLYPSGERGPGSLGISQMRQMARDFLEAYPEVETIGGERVSGAREGTAQQGQEIEWTRQALMGKPQPFVESATPAEKVEALSREYHQATIAREAGKLEETRLTREGVIPDEFDRPNFFQNLAKNEDPETQALAQGHDTTASWLKWMSDNWRDLLSDEAGTMPRAPATPATIRLYRGEGPQNTQGGGWFTTDPEKAKLYGKVKYIDVTRDELMAFAQGHGGADEWLTDSPAIKNRPRHDYLGGPAQPPPPPVPPRAASAPGGIPPRPPETELPPRTRRATILGKNTAEDLIRQVSTGLGAQKSEALAHGFEGFYKDLAPFLPRWRQELAKPFGGDAANTEIGKMLNALEGNGVIDPDSPFAPYAAARAVAHAKNVADLQAAVDRGEMNPMQLRDFYISHIYTDESINRVQGVTGGGNRTGSLGFTKQRTIPTYAEALAEGYKPKYDNPIMMDIAGIDAQQKALATLRMQAIARDANWMRYYTDAREAARDGFERVFGLNSEKAASTVLPTGEPGPPVFQNLYASKGFARIYNNWSQFENLQRSTTAATIEDALLKMKNASTYLKLMFPGYHTITLYKEGMANAMANALDEFGKGEVLRGIWDTAKVPFKPIEYVWRAGTKFRPMYRAMEADPALDAFVGGGGTLGARTKVYAASSQPNIWTLWKRGELGQAIGNDFRNAFTLPQTRAGEGLRGVATDLGNAVTLPFREIGRVATQITAPLWDHGVPLIKAGAAMERIQTFIRQNPAASDDAVRNFARTVVTNIEDRFGEYNSANMFWRPTLKRVANQAMLSTGWTYGTVDATLRGLGYRMGRGFEWDPVATTNLAAQFAMIALTNAAWSLAVDGKLPNSTLDYMIPFANARGIARILLPGEEKEWYDWAKVIAESISVGKDKGLGAAFQQFFQGTGQYAKGKLAPIWQAAWTWLSGEDAIGHKIAYTPGGIQKFLEDQFLPIFATNWKSSERIGLSYTQNLFGLREAPKWLANWDAWRAGQQRIHNKWTADELRRAAKEDAVTSSVVGAGGRGGAVGAGRNRLGGERQITPGSAFEYLRSRGANQRTRREPDNAYDYLNEQEGGGRIVTPYQGGGSYYAAPRSRGRGGGRRRR